jgi:myo-inositol-1(or 4)-monophosphatase
VELLSVCEEAARGGIEELLRWRGRIEVRQKAPRDLVTQADLASEAAIRRVIQGHFPNHGILGEENADYTQLERPCCWIVDPLDGTTNYAHGLPFYGVSIAVAVHGRLAAAVVYDPERDECFSAAEGAAATLNGVEMSVSRATALDEALAAVSFPATPSPEAPDLKAFSKAVPLCQAIRRTGSAALNLAYVACGRLDAHWAHELHPWDGAAGVLLVRQAGGVATSVEGRHYDLSHGDYLAAATPELHRLLLPVVND